MARSKQAFESNLSIPDILPVSKSWGFIKRKSGAVDEFASTLFHKFLSLAPKAAHAFNFSGDIEVDASIHTRVVGEALDRVFSSLFELDCGFLHELGKRHAHMDGFHPGFLSSFSMATLYALQQHLGRAWNARLKMRWERVVLTVVQAFGAGVESAGKRKAQPKSQPTHTWPRPETLDLDDATPVIESWEIIRGKTNYCEIFAELVFRKLFELAPGATALFPFGRFKGEKLYKSRGFKLHSMRVASTFDVVVTSLLDIEKAPLVALGARHASYGGVRVEHFAVLGLAVLAVLEKVLGDDWNDKLKGHWINVVSFLSFSMIEGMTSTRFV